MAFTAANVISDVRVVLKDPSGIRYTDAQLMSWINAGARQAVLMKPDITATFETITLVEGTEQSIPAEGHRLLSVLHNMSASDGVARRAVRPVSRETLDSQAPDWKSTNVTGFAAHALEVKNYHFDEQTPRNFHVFPGVNDTDAVWLRIAYSKMPTEVSSTSDAVDIPDIYQTAIMDYVCFRAYQHDAESDNNEQKATNHYAMFVGAVTGKSQIDQITTPNRRRGENR